jgi:hypothetical protein
LEVSGLVGGCIVGCYDAEIGPCIVDGDYLLIEFDKFVMWEFEVFLCWVDKFVDDLGCTLVD